METLYLDLGHGDRGHPRDMAPMAEALGDADEAAGAEATAGEDATGPSAGPP